jgi:hypothetical protein
MILDQTVPNSAQLYTDYIRSGVIGHRRSRSEMVGWLTPISDAGFGKFRERTPWERGQAIVHLSSLRNLFSDGDEGGHSPSLSAPCRAHGA